MFLQTACDTSTYACSSPRLTLFRGVMQGNGESPFLWMIMSIILIKYIYLKGLSTPQYSPMSQMMFALIALTCVDDTDLNVFDPEGKSTLEAIEAGQRMIDVWQFGLSVSGEDLKFEK